MIQNLKDFLKGSPPYYTLHTWVKGDVFTALKLTTSCWCFPLVMALTVLGCGVGEVRERGRERHREERST